MLHVFDSSFLCPVLAKSLLQYILLGKLMMIPLMVCSLAGLAVILDRGWAYWQNSKVDTRALRAQVLDLLGQGKIEEAANLCAATPSPVSAVLLAGLQSYAKHKPLNDKPESLTAIMEKSMDDYSQHAMSAVEKRLSILALVGNAAPLFGMTGTVTGMIVAFEAMATGGVSNEAVSNGISEALITTAAGLLIALAAVIPFHMFMGKADKIDLEIEEATSELLEYVATRVEFSNRQVTA